MPSLLSLPSLSSSSSIAIKPSLLSPEKKNADSTKVQKLSHSSSNTMKMSVSVGIVGCTGAVGLEILNVLKTRNTQVYKNEKENINFDIKKIHLYASERSAGKKIDTGSDLVGEVEIETFELEKAKSQCDIIFLAVGGDFALKYGPQLSDGENSCLVIDNSSAFRRDPEIPLIIPEINIKDVDTKKKKKLIANPNCTTAIALMALYPLHKAFGLKKVIMSTYQAASGAGAEGMAELKQGVKDWSQSNDINSIKNEYFAHPLAFNVIPHIDVFQENGYTKEEMKVAWETRKIMNLPNLPVSCTSVRIPTLRAHSEAITIETEKPIDINEAKKVLTNFPGLKLVDNPEAKVYPMPLTATEAFDVEVGRVRKNDVFGDYGLDIFVCGDQLLRGAALNAVLIAEKMI